MILAFALFLGASNDASANVLNNDLKQVNTQIVTNNPGISSSESEKISVKVVIRINKDGVEIKIVIRFQFVTHRLSQKKSSKIIYCNKFAIL